MNAAKPVVAVAASEIESKRHRARLARLAGLTGLTSPAPQNAAISATMPIAQNVSDDETDQAADLIAILAEALENIVATTTDASARAVAAEALTTFHGR